MTERYSALVVGAGRIGSTMEEDPLRPKPATHAGAWDREPGTSLLGFVDPDPSAILRACQAWPGTQGWPSLDLALTDIIPDIVSIATPPEAHEEGVLACAAAKVKAIVCEKPLALSWAAGNRMVGDCHASGSLLFVNHSRRFDPEIRRLASRCPAGKLRAMSGHYSGGMWNSGSHLIDLMRMFGGDVVRVQGEPSRVGAGKGDFSADALLSFQDWVSGVVQAHEALDYAIFQLCLYGSDGAVAISDSGYAGDYIAVIDHPQFSGYRSLDWRHATILFDEPRSFIAPMAEHVVACLDGRASPVSTGEDGLATVGVISSLNRSIYDTLVFRGVR